MIFKTFFGQHGGADAGVAELDERQAARLPVLLSDHQNVLGANVPVDDILVFLKAQKTNAERSCVLLKANAAGIIFRDYLTR